MGSGVVDKLERVAKIGEGQAFGHGVLIRLRAVHN